MVLARIIVLANVLVLIRDGLGAWVTRLERLKSEKDEVKRPEGLPARSQTLEGPLDFYFLAPESGALRRLQADPKRMSQINAILNHFKSGFH